MTTFLIIWIATLVILVIAGKFLYAWYAEIKIRNKYYQIQTELLLKLVQMQNPPYDLSEIISFLKEQKVRAIKSKYNSGKITEAEMIKELDQI